MIFIQKGDAPLSVRQATKRGKAHLVREMGAAGARPGDMDILTAMDHADLPQRLLDVLAALPGAPASYADYAASWEADNAVNGAHNLFNHQLAAYREAVARLTRYRLADGRAEITEERATGEYDPETGDEIIETVIVRPAIEPLDPLDPRVAQDDAERAHAQAVIDATPQEVREFVG